MTNETSPKKSLESYSKKELIALVFEQTQQIEFLMVEVTTLKSEVTRLAEENRELRAKLNMNSNNSSKPPSSDGYKKPNTHRSLRTTGKKRWGQVGHKGATLLPFETPDTTEILSVTTCSGCGESLVDVAMAKIRKRQVLDTPEPRCFVHEYIGGEKQCPCCHTITESVFPEGVTGDIQYGPNIKTLSVYLYNYGIISYDRIAEFYDEIYGINVSRTSLMKFNTEGYDRLAPMELRIKEAIKTAGIVHSDETWVRIDGTTKWIHTASTASHTTYLVHEKRGMEAMEAMAILVWFMGKLVHDHWRPYLIFKTCFHIFCNAHILRELIAAIENENETITWASRMKTLILGAKKLRDEAVGRGETHVDESILQHIHTEYRDLVQTGLSEYPELLRTPGTRGKIKRPKSQNLLERLRDHEGGTLEFLHDFNVPFDNNLAERDLRMVKVRTKVSGCFRSIEWARWFCRIRGYISTIRKQWLPVYPAMKSLFTGNVLSPKF